MTTFEEKVDGFTEVHKRERFSNELALVYADGRTAVIQATREEMLERIGRACAAGDIPFPEHNGPVSWPLFEIKDALALAA